MSGRHRLEDYRARHIAPRDVGRIVLRTTAGGMLVVTALAVSPDRADSPRLPMAERRPAVVEPPQNWIPVVPPPVTVRPKPPMHVRKPVAPGGGGQEAAQARRVGQAVARVHHRIRKARTVAHRRSAPVVRKPVAISAKPAPKPAPPAAAAPPASRASTRAAVPDGRPQGHHRHGHHDHHGGRRSSCG